MEKRIIFMQKNAMFSMKIATCENFQRCKNATLQDRR